MNIAKHRGETAMMRAMTYQSSIADVIADPAYYITGPENV